MAHLAILSNFLAALVEALTFGVFLSLYRSGRSPLIRSFLVYTLAGFFQAASAIAGLYATAVLGFRGPAVPILNDFCSTLYMAFLAYASPRFFLAFADLPFTGTVRRLAIGSVAVILVSSPLVFARDLPAASGLSHLPPGIGLVAFLAFVLYGQARLIKAYPRIKDRLGRIGVPAIVAYNAFCLAAGIGESLASSAQLSASGEWPTGLLLSPAIAIAWNGLALAWAFAWEGSGTFAARGGVEPVAELARRFGLTERELELSRLLASGAANKEMAASLGLSANTVRNHVHNIYEKTGARNRVELVRALCGADS